MPVALAEFILCLALAMAYVFKVIPALGHKLGNCEKAHWVGYSYKNCMKRGIVAHFYTAIGCFLLWALVTKLMSLL